MTTETAVSLVSVSPQMLQLFKWVATMAFLVFAVVAVFVIAACIKYLVWG